MSETSSNPLGETKNAYSDEFKLKAGIFLGTVTGISALIGFSTTIAAAKRKDPEFFNKGMVPAMRLQESGAHLALKALGWGTVYAVTGCGIIFYSIWKLSGANNMLEFRNKMGSILPRIPKNDPPVGRTEFSGLNDFLNYVQYLKSSKDQ